MKSLRTRGNVLRNKEGWYFCFYILLANFPDPSKEELATIIRGVNRTWSNRARISKVARPINKILLLPTEQSSSLPCLLKLPVPPCPPLEFQQQLTCKSSNSFTNDQVLMKLSFRNARMGELSRTVSRRVRPEPAQRGGTNKVREIFGWNISSLRSRFLNL